MSSLFTSAPDRANSVPFAALASSRSRVVLLGAPESGHDRDLEPLRSLTFEHVSVSRLLQAEIERNTSFGIRAARSLIEGRPVAADILLAVVRKWFWSRRSGRGFLLEGFPTNLGQALILDEWLEARGESLDRVVLCSSDGFGVDGADPVIRHYDRQAILTRLSPETNRCDDLFEEEPDLVPACS